MLLGLSSMSKLDVDAGPVTRQENEPTEPPATWECRLHGSISRLVDGNEPEQKKAKPPRTHWDMLLERRTIPELEDLLSERLQELKVRRSRSA